MVDIMRQSKWLPRLAWLFLLGGFCYAATDALFSPAGKWAMDVSKTLPQSLTKDQASEAIKGLSQQYDDHLRSTMIPGIVMLVGGIMGLAARPEDNRDQVR